MISRAEEKNKGIKIKIRSLNFSYQNQAILDNVSTQFKENTITALSGPSGTGKSTFLMTLNRLWENIPGSQMSGKVEIKLNGRFQNIYEPGFNLSFLRRSVGMVFQIPNPLPMSIFKNAAFPLKLSGFRDKKLTAEKVKNVLKTVCLWDEVKDRLKDNAFALSGGQQQRLCLARALISKPEVLLLDEPTSSLDSKAALIIEDLLVSLKKNCTIIIVSHYLDQIKRIADQVIEMPFDS